MQDRQEIGFGSFLNVLGDTTLFYYKLLLSFHSSCSYIGL